MKLIATGHRHPDGSLHARLQDGRERIVPPETRVAYRWTNMTRTPPTWGADRITSGGHRPQEGNR